MSLKRRDTEQARAHWDHVERVSARLAADRTADELRRQNEDIDVWKARCAERDVELAQWRAWGIVEIAVRNVNVKSYMDHWEGRALKAEAEIARRDAGVSKDADVGPHALCCEPGTCLCPCEECVRTRTYQGGALWNRT